MQTVCREKVPIASGPVLRPLRVLRIDAKSPPMRMKPAGGDAKEAGAGAKSAWACAKPAPGRMKPA